MKVSISGMEKVEEVVSFNFVNNKSFGILSEEFRNEVIKADIIRGKLTQLMSENSKWRIKRKYHNGKYSKATIVEEQD